MKSLKKIRFAALFAALAIAVVGCSHSAGGGDGDDGHSHAYSSEWKSNDTSHWKECSCGEKSEAASHTEGNWTEVTPATETDDGEEKTTCTVCGKEYTRVIPALGHSHAYSSEWKSNDTSHWKECSCGEKSEVASHTEGTWQVETPATVTSTGVEKTTCTVCSKELTREIAQLDIGVLLNNKIIGTTECLKTSEVEIIPTGTTVTVSMADDSSWSGYVANSASDYYKGVFIKGRAVTLSPFAMGKYEVTQELFEKVMGTNPSYCVETNSAYKNMLDSEMQKLRPVENVNWYHAIAFCNKLSILQGLEPCYEVSGITDWANLAYSSIPTSSDATWNAATCDFTKKGYRLPTEAEWEFAARGGDPTKPEWRYAFSGVNVAEGNMVHNGSTYLDNDANLEDYAWYDNNAYDKGSGNAGYGTHEVGTKKANTLGLYDMSGNVWEWCWDWYSSTVSTAAATNPAGAASGSYRLLRGGSWYRYADFCAVSYRNDYNPYYRYYYIGFRLARSL